MSLFKKLKDYAKPKTWVELQRREETAAHLKEVEQAEGAGTIEATKIISRLAPKPDAFPKHSEPAQYRMPSMNPGETLRTVFDADRKNSPPPAVSPSGFNPQTVIELRAGQRIFKLTPRQEKPEPENSYPGLSPSETLLRIVEQTENSGRLYYWNKP